MTKSITRQERTENLKKWTKGGIYRCPKCNNSDILHITIHDEGEKLLCKGCNYFEIIAEEYTRARRGFSLEGYIT